LNADPVLHWIAANDARNNLMKREYFRRFGIASGLRHLVEEHPPQSRSVSIPASNPKGVAA
jgi:hypothetical protein